MIPVYLCNAAGNTVITIDDTAVSTDLGQPFVARLLSLPFEAGGWSTFRRFVQKLIIGNSATLTIKPVADGSESAGDAQVLVFDAAVHGMSVVAEAPFAKGGTQHRVALEVTAHDGRVSLGDWERWLVPRRSER